jgi:hypothetical protein
MIVTGRFLGIAPSSTVQRIKGLVRQEPARSSDAEKVSSTRAPRSTLSVCSFSSERAPARRDVNRTPFSRPSPCPRGPAPTTVATESMSCAQTFIPSSTLGFHHRRPAAGLCPWRTWSARRWCASAASSAGFAATAWLFPTLRQRSGLVEERPGSLAAFALAPSFLPRTGPVSSLYSFTKSPGFLSRSRGVFLPLGLALERLQLRRRSAVCRFR